MEDQTPTQTPAPTSQPAQQLTPEERMAQIEQREKHLKDYEGNLNNQIETYNTQLKEKMSKYSRYEDIDKKLEANPLEALKELGLSYDKLVELGIDQNLPKTEDDRLAQVEARIEELNKLEKEKIEKQENEAKQKEIDKTINNYKQGLQQDAEAGEGKYELYLSMDLEGAADLAYNVAENHFTKFGKAPDNATVLEFVENYLEDQYKTQIELLKKTNKFKGMFVQESVETPRVTTGGNQGQQTFAQHLDNNSSQKSGQNTSLDDTQKLNAGSSFEQLRDQKLFELKKRLNQT